MAQPSSWINPWAAAQNTADVMKPPTPPKPKVAPVTDDLERRRAAAREASRRRSGAGRAGTMLTGDDNQLG